MITNRIFQATALPRILDQGWTDTWFYKPKMAGCQATITSVSVLSRPFGAEPSSFLGIDVLMNLQESRQSLINIVAADSAYNRTVRTKDLLSGDFDHKNLLLAVLSLLPLQSILKYSLTIRIMSPIPPGASMGTSAAVSVGIVKCFGEILQFLGYDSVRPSIITQLCWKAETEVMGGQSGIQDQAAAAEGLGFNKIVVTDFPQVELSRISVPENFNRKFQRCLLTVFVGQHDSSGSHKKVIDSERRNSFVIQSTLGDISRLAENMVDCYQRGDLRAIGELMKENTRLQEKLNPELVGEHHQRIIGLAKYMKALGWKVNGAGGDGGTVTLLFTSRRQAEAFHNDAQQFFAGQPYEYFEHQIA